LTLVTLITLIIPIVICLVFPGKSEKVLGSLKAWLLKHSKAVGVAVLLVFGTYLLVKGITAVI
jgi:hypothetical protein